MRKTEPTETTAHILAASIEHIRRATQAANQALFHLAAHEPAQALTFTERSTFHAREAWVKLDLAEHQLTTKLVPPKSTRKRTVRKEMKQQ